jgi:hypothetical protein
MNDMFRPVWKRLRAARRSIAFLFVAFAVSACAAQPPAGRIDLDESQDFSAYRTFAWISEHPMRVGPVVADPRDSIEPKVMDAIRARLEAKGFEYVAEADNPDFVVSFTVGSRERARPEGFTDPNAGARWSWGTDFQSGAEGAVYTQGVLAIDILDSVERRRVWHGVASRRINEADREDMRGLIDSVVASILAEFPPR